MTETKKNLIKIVRTMPLELYECGDNSKIIMELAKKYYEVYGDEELRPYVEEYEKNPNHYIGI